MSAMTQDQERRTLTDTAFREASRAMESDSFDGWDRAAKAWYALAAFLQRTGFTLDAEDCRVKARVSAALSLESPSREVSS